MMQSPYVSVESHIDPLRTLASSNNNQQQTLPHAYHALTVDGVYQRAAKFLLFDVSKSQVLLHDVAAKDLFPADLLEQATDADLARRALRRSFDVGSSATTLKAGGESVNAGVEVNSEENVSSSELTEKNAAVERGGTCDDSCLSPEFLLNELCHCLLLLGAAPTTSGASHAQVLLASFSRNELRLEFAVRLALGASRVCRVFFVPSESMSNGMKKIQVELEPLVFAKSTLSSSFGEHNRQLVAAELDGVQKGSPTPVKPAAVLRRWFQFLTLVAHLSQAEAVCGAVKEELAVSSWSFSEQPPLVVRQQQQDVSSQVSYQSSVTLLRNQSSSSSLRKRSREATEEARCVQLTVTGTKPSLEWRFISPSAAAASDPACTGQLADFVAALLQ